MKYSLLFAILLFISTSTRATCSFTDIYLQIKVSYDDKEVKHNDKPRSPMKMPKIQQNGNILILPSNSVWYLELIQCDGSENIVFSQFTTSEANTITLPESLFGEYEIRLTRNNICFFGYINL